MKNQYSISLYLDTRRAKKNGLFPVKLRVYANELEKQKLYPTMFEFTENDFKRAWLSKKTPNEFIDVNEAIKSIQTKARNVAKSLDPFTFDKFEKLLLQKSGAKENVLFYYSEYINYLRKLNRYSTAYSYEYSQNSIIDYILYLKGKPIKESVKNFLLQNPHLKPKNLNFNEITVDWLKSYEYYMINHLEKSKTTIGIYLRNLRALFNKAIRENEISSEYYPFGKHKYKIPKSRNIKKALSKEQIKILFNSIPRTPEQAKAKDFWFLSYALNGMNLKDIMLLKNKDIEDSMIIYDRAKTINTKEADALPSTVHLNDYSTSIIEKYRTDNKAPKDFIFPIINKSMNEDQKYRTIKNFTRFVNQNIKKLAKHEGLPEAISSYWARHSFATLAIQKGASLELISEAFNHSSLQTTKNYFKGFDDKVKKELSQNLMNF